MKCLDIGDSPRFSVVDRCNVWVAGLGDTCPNSISTYHYNQTKRHVSCRCKEHRVDPSFPGGTIEISYEEYAVLVVMTK